MGSDLTCTARHFSVLGQRSLLEPMMISLSCDPRFHQSRITVIRSHRFAFHRTRGTLRKCPHISQLSKRGGSIAWKPQVTRNLCREIGEVAARRTRRTSTRQHPLLDNPTVGQ